MHYLQLETFLAHFWQHAICHMSDEFLDNGPLKRANFGINLTNIICQM